MKQNLKSIWVSLLAIALLHVSGPVYAQMPASCGTDNLGERINSFRKAYFENLDRPDLLHRDANDVTYVPLTVTIVKNNRGKSAVEADLVLPNICVMNKYFSEAGIIFYIKKVNYVANQNLYNIDHLNTAILALRSYKDDNALNIFFVNEANGNCGFYTPHADAVVVKNTCRTSDIIAHELGHNLGLPHTFNGWEFGNTPPVSQRELVDGSNCKTAGDRFCDTPADYFYYLWECPYEGEETDRNGDLLRPDGTLIMSYAYDYYHEKCKNRFSDEQLAFMKAYLKEQYDDIIYNSVPYFIANKQATTNVPEDSAIVGGNTVTFSWAKVEHATSYRFNIDLLSFNDLNRFTLYNEYEDIWSEPNNEIRGEYYANNEIIVEDTFLTFTGLVSGKNKWWVEPIYENDYIPCKQPEIQESSFLYYKAKDEFIESGNEIILFPNPVRNNTPVNLISRKELDNAELNIFGANGQKIYNNTISGKMARMVLPPLEKGLYLVRIHTGDAVVTKRLVLDF